MIPRKSQEIKSAKALQVLRDNMIVYLAMEERTGKTLAAILTCEQLAISNVLVLTKKTAVAGWTETLDAYSHTKQFTVTNYHQAEKCDTAHDLVVLDESHNYISSFPKRSATWKAVKRLTKGKPIIYISATPHAQGYQLLYNQFALSDWSPWRKWTSPYSWFRDFGVPTLVYLAGRQIEQYKKTRPDTYDYVKHLFITGTRAELGFKHEPKDKVHYIELAENTKAVYNILCKDKILELNGHMVNCDTPTKLRTALHQLEGGTLKTHQEGDIKISTVLQLGNCEKIDYIKANWGDTEQLVIMYNFKGEKIKLEAAFKQAKILQATSNAEGIDLHKVETLVVYSQDYSTARHSQRRARQANLNRATPIVVHFLLVRKAISDQVYTTVVKNKKNFIDSTFKETII